MALGAAVGLLGAAALDAVLEGEMFQGQGVVIVPMVIVFMMIVGLLAASAPPGAASASSRPRRCARSSASLLRLFVAQEVAAASRLGDVLGAAEKRDRVEAGLTTPRTSAFTADRAADRQNGDHRTNIGNRSGQPAGDFPAGVALELCGTWPYQYTKQISGRLG